MSVVEKQQRLVAFADLESYWQFATTIGIATPTHTALGFPPEEIDEIAKSMKATPLYIVETSKRTIVAADSVLDNF